LRLFFVLFVCLFVCLFLVRNNNSSANLALLTRSLSTACQPLASKSLIPSEAAMGYGYPQMPCCGCEGGIGLG
jgi:hypothetical protein